jgi:diketogulonate reductase-like aldo/keto reductase
MKTATDPSPLTDPVVTAIAEAHGSSTAQVLIAWAIKRGTTVIPKSVSEVWWAWRGVSCALG